MKAYVLFTKILHSILIIALKLLYYRFTEDIDSNQTSEKVYSYDTLEKLREYEEKGMIQL